MLSVVTLIHPPNQSIYLHSPENNAGSMLSVSTLIHSTTHPNIHTHTHAAHISSLTLSTQPMLICPTAHLPSHLVPTNLSNCTPTLSLSRSPLHSPNQPVNRPPTLSFSHPLICPVTHLFIHWICPTTHLPSHSVTHLFIHPTNLSNHPPTSHCHSPLHPPNQSVQPPTYLSPNHPHLHPPKRAVQPPTYPLT